MSGPKIAKRKKPAVCPHCNGAGERVVFLDHGRKAAAECEGCNGEGMIR